MSASDLDKLAEELESLPKGTTLRGALEVLRTTKSSGPGEAERRCALVRWLDEPLYDFLTIDIPKKIQFNAFIDLAHLHRLGPDRYILEESERARLLAEWQSDEKNLREWNQKIGDYFVARGGADEQLCAVYHLAASPNPAVVAASFEVWYRDADDRFDLAYCNALLEMLRVQQRFRGPALSALWRDRSRYFETRMLFADDYYKTGSYFERSEVLKQFLQVLEPEATRSNAWIFHIHATGGTGKTMFLRWLVSRHLVPRRIVCARVDFDDFQPRNEPFDRPLRLLVRIVEQWSQQVPGLDSLLERLNREERTPGWNASVLELMTQQLAGARLITPLVVILDTLEEATISHAGWLRECVDSLRVMRESIPELKLVLSGRYDISNRSDALAYGEFVSFELPRFSEQESHEYLESRGIPVGRVRAAIVERAGYDESSADDGTDRLKGRNPFKLAIFAEIVLHRKNMNAEDIYALPRADVAYLIERVIERIESQPLRWMIRYGAIARHLTLEFVDRVLMPPLREALRGNLLDQPQEGLIPAYHDTWKREPTLADQISTNSLWEELKKYARDRGWISVSTVLGKTGLRFHPEVAGPVRELLRNHAIFPLLQNRAFEHFNMEADKPDVSEDEWVRNVREAVFHRFQVHGWDLEQNQERIEARTAADFWKERVAEAENASPARALKVAAEVLGSDYAEDEQTPVNGITPDFLVEAHIKMADLLLQDAGIRFAAGRNRDEFLRHCISARGIANKWNLAPLPDFLVMMLNAWSSRSPSATVTELMRARGKMSDPRAEFFFTLHAAQNLVLSRSHEAVGLYRQALELMPLSSRTGVQVSEIWLALTEYYEFEGAHTAVISCLQEARASAEGNSRMLAKVVDLEASYALSVGDLESAGARLSEILSIKVEHHPTPATCNLLEARLALANADPLKSLAANDEGRHSSVDLDGARLLDQAGEAYAMLLEFTSALSAFESASSRYDLAKVPTGSSRCALLSARLNALLIRNYREAESLIEAGLRLRGSGDARIYSEFLMLRAFVERERGDGAAARKTVEELLRDRALAWPSEVRAKGMLFALFFGFREPTADFLEEIVENVADLQPMTLRDRVLEWAEHSHERIHVSALFVRRLMTSLVKSRPGSADAVRRLIIRADVLRVLNSLEFATAQLQEAEAAMIGMTEEASLILEWELNRARQRMRLNTSFHSQFLRGRSSKLAGKVIQEVIQAAAARESHNEQLALFKGKLDLEVPNVFQAEKLRFLAYSASRDRLAAEQEAREYYRILGWDGWDESPRRQSDDRVWIAEKYVSYSLLEQDYFVGRLLKDLHSVCEELSGILMKASNGDLSVSVALEPESQLGGLPWELATVLQGCRILYRICSSLPPMNLEPVQVEHETSVLFFGQDEHEAESLEVQSGGRIEQIYAQFGAWPRVIRETDSKRWQQALGRETNPVLVHISGTLRETDSGIFIDFAGTDVRAASFAVGSLDKVRNASDLSLSVSRLDRALHSVKQPPFVVLDAANPYNQTEAIRMLLLRNQFATQLFGLGHVRGILGCGLASPWERYGLSQKTVAGLMTKSVSETLMGLRELESSDGEIESLLPRLGAALWTNNPNDRLFA